MWQMYYQFIRIDILTCCIYEYRRFSKMKSNPDEVQKCTVGGLAQVLLHFVANFHNHCTDVRSL